MRNLKKLLAVIVAICVIATFTVPAFAAESAISADGQLAADLGVLQGDETAGGVTAAYLADSTYRWQAAVITVRLLGKEAAALAATGENFTDAADLAWKDGQNILAYLKQNPDLGWVGDAGKFDPNSKITAQMLYKVILTALGYKEDTGAGGDFKYADTITFAATVGLTKIATKTALTNDDMATALIEGLKANLKDGSSNLATKLVDAGVLNKAAATTAGMYSATITATAAQTGAKTITVTFNRALTAAEKTAATVDVKCGLVAYTVTSTWAADNKSVALAYEYNLFAGDYTVTVGGITAPLAVTVADEKITKMTIENGYLPLQDAAGVTYKVYNQFNEVMENVSDLTFSAFNATKAMGVIGAGSDATTFEVDLLANANGDASAKDDTIILTVTHKSGVSVSKTVKVSDLAAPKTLSFGAVAPLEGETRITEGDEGLVLPYTFTDQYGNAYTLPDYVASNDGDNREAIGNVLFTTSDATIINPDSFAVDADGVLTFTAAGDGTAVITAIVPATGVVATVSIKVEAEAALKSFTMSNPGKLIAAGDTVVIPYTAMDTFGAPIAQKDFIDQQADVTFVASNKDIVPDANLANDVKFNGKNELTLSPEDSGSLTLYAYVGGVLQNSITLDIKALAVPSRITGLTDVPTIFQALGTDNIEMSNLKVIDQYNRPIDLGLYGADTYTVTIAYDGTAGDAVTLGGDLEITGAADAATLTGDAAGSDKLIFSLMSDADVDALSTYKTTVKTIADDDIKGYTVDTIATLYGDDGNTSASAFAVTPKLLGKDASGNAVTLDQGTITAVTSSKTSVVKVDGLKIYAVKAGTATVAIWKDGTKLAEAAVTALDEEPYAVTAVFDPTSQTMQVGDPNINLAATLTVEDQYGVAIADAGKWSSSDTDVATAIGGSLHAVDVGTATITYVTSTGVVATVDVTVDP